MNPAAFAILSAAVAGALIGAVLIIAWPAPQAFTLAIIALVLATWCYAVGMVFGRELERASWRGRWRL